MYKVFAFLKRNPNITHDEYRAGHVGHHCCHSRRLKNIRGYLVNIWANTPLKPQLGTLYDEITRNEPADFTGLWDGFPQVYFDDQASWTQAATAEPTRAMASGLVIDPDWSLADGPDLFEQTPQDPTQFRSYHLHMEEHLVLPVLRPEQKLTKLMHFTLPHSRLSDAEFRQRVLGDYAPLVATLPNLRGYTQNFRDPDQEAAMRNFYADDSWGFSAAATAERRRFCALFSGAAELHFDSVTAFAEARQGTGLHQQLTALEQELFEANWYVEVDENLIVMPNRDPAPEFYFR